jgi:hypothetical protein
VCVLAALVIQHKRRTHCHLCRVWLYHILPHDLITDTISPPPQKKVTEYKMCVLVFSPTSVCNISHSRTEWDTIINVPTSTCKVPVIPKILMRLEFSWQIFKKKYSNIKFHENPNNSKQMNTEMEGQTTQIIVTSHNIVNRP